ncbi:sentrin-specific protease 5 [Brachionus plicatilis]|uniref:Sentrin-specific protease 5 n=1 Tax=Brachionus plicatilis TaxID=10195 RepID=A0A3M7PRN2_BRAPC|nr:sentrin-specific protease 5 [Brachionus plicatilis]
MDKALACSSLAKKYVKSNDGISALVKDSNGNGNTNSSAKVSDLVKNLELSLLTTISNEIDMRLKNRKFVVIYSLKESSNDDESLENLFSLLKIDKPLHHKRLGSFNISKCNRPVLCELKNEKSIKMLMLVKKNLRNENDFSDVYINSHKTKLQRDILLEKRKNLKNFTSKSTADFRLPPVGHDNLSQAKSMNTTKSASKTTSDSNPICTQQSFIKSNLWFSQNDPKSQEAILNHDDGLTVIVKGFGYEVNRLSLYGLLSGSKINDIIVNFYMKMLCNSNLNVKCSHIDSLIINKILDVYNSNNEIIEKIRGVLKKYITSLADSDSWMILNYHLYPKQYGNDKDCGVFICAFSKYLSYDKPFLFNQNDIPKIRESIGSEILKVEIQEYDTLVQ